MYIVKITALLISLFALSGCISPEGRLAIQEEQRALQEKQDRAIQTIPVCNGEKDCAAKWEVAQLWVSQNAGYKIQTSTNVIIETYNSRDSGLAANITKEPLGSGKYKIVAKIWCRYESQGPYSCSPYSLDATLDFNAKVTAATP